MKEKKDRVDDALHATRAAVQEGIVPGGGVAYIRAIEALKNPQDIGVTNEDQITGVNIVRLALESPLRTIAENAGQEGSVIVNKVRDGKKDYGYNARDNKFETFFEAGIIDPTKVTRLALENAASIAGLLLTTEAVVSDIPEEKDAPAMPHGGGMGGMM
jgi:chaperonin GroEL